MARHWRRPITVILCLAVVIPLSSSATAAAEPSAEQIQDAVDFRTTFGLPHSISRVEASYQDPEAYPDMQWGVPLSEDEAGDLLRRLELRAGQDDAVAYAQDQPAFGGLWFDQLDGGTAHYTFTNDVAEHRSAILGMTPKGADIHVTQADYRMSELTEIRDEITRDMLSLIDGGMPITMVDADPQANRVIVYLAEPHDGARQVLRDRYGAAVITELGAEGVPDCNGSGPTGEAIVAR